MSSNYFYPSKKSEKERTDRINRYIDNAIGLGLMKGLKGSTDSFEIMRITKALINADWLGSMDEQLASYRKAKSSTDGDELDD